MGKLIVAYHVEILVRDKSGGLVKLLIDLDDWYSDSDVAVKLAEMLGKFVPSTLPGDLTFGELVWTLRDVVGKLRFKAPVLDARVVAGGQGTDSSSIRGWDERVC